MINSIDFPDFENNYGTLNSMVSKYKKYGRKNYFKGSKKDDFSIWKKESKKLLENLIGLNKMEESDLSPVFENASHLSDGIKRECWRIQVEPEVWMPFYILVPENTDKNTRIFICPHGHGGAGKYTVAGLKEYPFINEKIEFYNYDYGIQLAKKGFVAICPDSRGFGERREDSLHVLTKADWFKSDCHRLARMGEPLGITVIGMLVWDLTRLIDYITVRGDWGVDKISCLGFSGGGMQTLWLSALDIRVKFAVISGYMYGYKDSLLKLNENCSCNYVPSLWQYFDMGDIGSLISPRPLIIQSCKDDRLNGERGLENVYEQVEIIQAAYNLTNKPDKLIHEVCDGGHRWHDENLLSNMALLLEK